VTAWLAGAADGSIRDRSGDVYKPSFVRGYEQALRLRVLPVLGPVPRPPCSDPAAGLPTRTPRVRWSGPS
jgi:hypothetical protein